MGGWLRDYGHGLQILNEHTQKCCEIHPKYYSKKCYLIQQLITNYYKSNDYANTFNCCKVTLAHMN